MSPGNIDEAEPDYCDLLSVEEIAMDAFVTVHPSALLRIKDESDKRRQYRLFVDDPRLASRAIKR
jgi:hypothetical protein